MLDREKEEKIAKELHDLFTTSMPGASDDNTFGLLIPIIAASTVHKNAEKVIEILTQGEDIAPKAAHLTQEEKDNKKGLTPTCINPHSYNPYLNELKNMSRELLNITNAISDKLHTKR